MKYRRSLPALALMATLGLSLSACGGAPAVETSVSPSKAPVETSVSPSPSLTSAAAVVEEEAPTPTPTPEITVAEIGETATNGGIQIKVKKAVAAPTVTLNTSDYRAGSGYETYENVPAQAGGRYIIVDAVVTNNAKAPIDLTCSFPIDIKLFNMSSQVFSPIEDVRKIKGNPECNAQLQPGFESAMTWAFLVPAKSTILGTVFSEVDFEKAGLTEPTIISFGAGL